MKEGGGPKAEQIVLNFFVPIRGGRVGVNEFRTKSPNFTIFFLKASLSKLLSCVHINYKVVFSTGSIMYCHCSDKMIPTKIKNQQIRISRYGSQVHF